MSTWTALFIVIVIVALVARFLWDISDAEKDNKEQIEILKEIRDRK